MREEQITKSYMLRESELAVLLTLCGMKQFFGIQLEGMDKPDQQEIHQTVFSLMRKEILSKEETGIVIREDIRELVNSLVYAKQMLLVASDEEEIPQKLIYIGERMVQLQPVGQQAKQVRVTCLREESLSEYLIEQGFCIPQMRSVEPEMRQQEEAVMNEEDAIIWRGRWTEDMDCLLNHSDIKAAVMQYDLESKSKKSQFCIVSLGIEDRLIYSDERTDVSYPYTEEMSKKLLQSRGGMT